MEEAFLQLSSGKAVVPLRTGFDIEKGVSSALFMPVYLPSTNLLGIKTVTIFNNNPGINKPMIQAVFLAFNAEDGSPLAMIDGEALTSLRTGAAGGLAAKLLSRENSTIVFIFGAGVQGESQLRAVCNVRKIKKAYVTDVYGEKISSFIRKMSQELSLDIQAGDAETNLKEADIICTATSSYSPVFKDEYLKKGVHINGIGSFKPEMAEIPPETVQRSKIVVDSKSACLAEAGDIIQPMKAGIISPDSIHAELGEILSGKKSGRKTPEEITFFKSVGSAVQDLAAAHKIIQKLL